MKHKKALVISFTLATSLMSGHAMAAYAGALGDNAAAGAGLLSTIISSGNKAGAFSAVDNAKGGIYFFRENIRADKLIKDFDKVVPIEKYGKANIKSQEVRHIIVTGNDLKLSGNVWYETGKGGSQHLVQLALAPYSPIAVEIPGIGKLIVPGTGDFGDLPEMNEPANDVSVIFPSLEVPSAEDDIPTSLPGLNVLWPDDGSVSAEPVSFIDDTVDAAPSVEDPAPPAPDNAQADAAAQAAADAAAQAAADAAAQTVADAGGNGPPDHSNAGGNGNGNGPPDHSNAGGNGNGPGHS
ncbi:MAG: hypothetical protein K8R48_06380 [Alphaproteobacteria bacterium]|nr:hypothetical protein [Alphaproteobacteria bacterium]